MSLGVGPSRGGLAGAARAVLKLVIKEFKCVLKEFGGHMLDVLMACPNSSIALILISSFPVVLVMSDVHHNISL